MLRKSRQIFANLLKPIVRSSSMKFFCIPTSLFCRSGPIEQLDFSQLRLDQVPREIFKARKHIEELLLNVNSIEELPHDLFRCTKIRRLDVSENKIKLVPANIGALSSLVELNLSKNEIVEVPEEIGLCNNLAYLDISTNIVTGFPKSFVNLTQLSSLNLSNNSITHLPQDIDGLVNLQFLDVAQCELRLLPSSIVHLEKLRVLDLCDNYLTELPPNMDRLISLEMLDLHCNMIGSLPDELLRCRSLRTLDISGNQLTELPLNIGDLQNMAELVLCENQIRHLPSSIGQLKKLEVLKASKNNLAILTPSICSCALLTDLVLCENQLQEIPSSIGNLRRLRFLDLNVNNLHTFPPTIGGCQSLVILSLRHNHLSELPMEIGKLNQLQVLDLADNSLQYLPYTLTVLYKAKTLSALWLSFNQPPLPKLTTTHEPVMNIKVLTCYLLPQKGAAQQQSEAARIGASTNKSCVGGARVCFAGDSPPEEDDKMPIGKFERYDTPHPKPFAPKNRLSRNSGDFSGLVPPSPSTTGTGGQTAKTAQTIEEGQQTQRSAVEYGASNDGANGNIGGVPLSNSSDVSATAMTPHGTVMTEESRPLRSVLKRRPQSVISHISTPELMVLLNNNNMGNNMSFKKGSIKLVRKNIQLRRGAGGFEWTIVGGTDSLPYKGKSGLFISQLVPGGVAHSAGFRVDDCLLAVNGNDLRGLTHQEAIQRIQTASDRLELLIEREQRLTDDTSRFLSEATSPPRPPERCCAMIVRNKCGLPGFTVSGAGRWPDNPFIVARVDVAESSLRSGDRILSVGGTNVKFGARLDQIKTLLAGFPGTRVEVVVERGGDWPPPPLPKLLPKRYGALACATGQHHSPLSSSSAFGEMTLTRSLPSLFVPTPNGGDTDGATELIGEAFSHSNLHKMQQNNANNNNIHNICNPSRPSSMASVVPSSHCNHQATPSATIVPPPVAPKPKTNFTSFSITAAAAAHSQQQQQNVVTTTSSGGDGVERSTTVPSLTNGGTAANMVETKIGDFSSRLRLFQQQQQQQQQPAGPKDVQTAASTNSLLSGQPPKLKRPLLSSDDLAKLAEDDRMRSKTAAAHCQQQHTLMENDRRVEQSSSSSVDTFVAAAEHPLPSSPPQIVSGGASPMSPIVDSGTFEHILNDSPVPLGPSSIGSIRTKKAENRFLQANTNNNGNPVNANSSIVVRPPSSSTTSSSSPTINQLLVEQQRRKEWRQARMASLEAESRRVNQLITDVQETIGGGQQQTVMMNNNTEVLDVQ